MNDKYLTSLDIRTGLRDDSRPRHTGLYRLGCFVAGLLLLSVLAALVSGT